MAEENKKNFENHESVAGEWRPGLAQDRSWSGWESGSGSSLDKFERVLTDTEGFLRDRFERQPYATAAVAMGVGFILGRGFRSPLARTLLSAGFRAAVTGVLANHGLRDGE